MKESEYINTTSLAKLRIVNQILYDCVFTDETNKALLADVIQRVKVLIDSEYNKIKIEGEL